MSRVAVYADGRTWRSDAGKHLACTWLEYADHGTLAVPTHPPGQPENCLALLKMVCLTDAPRMDAQPRDRTPPILDEGGRAAHVERVERRAPLLLLVRRLWVLVSLRHLLWRLMRRLLLRLLCDSRSLLSDSASSLTSPSSIVPRHSPSASSCIIV